ncbi:MAG: RHS repeat-associated core domain-containing protein, partial [Armatimonadetes bacterium]|nr:RHS repeat-associated core domain-containing protein [Armatimonadota bacterium]
YYFDGLGSTVMMTQGLSTITDRYDYDAWGNEYPIMVSTADNPYRYVGQLGYYTHWMDSSLTDLLHLGVRFYEPGVGRFSQVDPARDGVNWYGYVDDKPTRYVDPAGLHNDDIDVIMKNKRCRQNAMAKYTDCIKARVGYGIIQDTLVCLAVCGGVGIGVGIFSGGIGGAVVFGKCMTLCLGVGMPCTAVYGVVSCSKQLFKDLKHCDELYPIYHRRR